MQPISEAERHRFRCLDLSDDQIRQLIAYDAKVDRRDARTADRPIASSAGPATAPNR
jgi:hypothetical protein